MTSLSENRPVLLTCYKNILHQIRKTKKTGKKFLPECLYVMFAFQKGRKEEQEKKRKTKQGQ